MYVDSNDLFEAGHTIMVQNRIFLIKAKGKNKKGPWLKVVEKK